MQEIDTEVMVLGGGPGGYTAAFRAADLGKQVVLVEQNATLGGVCLNVGCIPSKALLHAAKVITEAREVAEFGIIFAEPQVDIDKLRGWKESVIKKLTTGLSGLAKKRGVTVVNGVGKFISNSKLEVDGAEQTVINFQQAIIAAGSEAAELPCMPKDERIFDSTGALNLASIPKQMLIIGGGIIGLEMATVYSALGSQVSIVEFMDQLVPGADIDLIKPLHRFVSKKYQAIMLKTKVTAVKPKPEGIEVNFEGENAPASAQLYDAVLVAVGRRPNGNKIGADKAGVKVDERGFIAVDDQMRTNVENIFAIGDVVGNPMLAHKAVCEGHIAAEVISGHDRHFSAKVIPSVAYTDPEVAWVGLTENEAKAQNIEYRKASFPWMASGRSLSIGRSEGMTSLLFDPESERLLGGAIIGTNAGELIGELALAIEKGCSAADIAHTIHPHPTLSETIMMSAEAFLGTITDLYMPKQT